jgi:hypothetical protein
MHNVHLFLLAKKAPKTLSQPMVLTGIAGICSLSRLQRSTADVAERGNHAQPLRIFAPASLSRRFRVFCAHQFPPFKEARLSNRRRHRPLNVRNYQTHGGNDARIADGHVSSRPPPAASI